MSRVLDGEFLEQVYEAAVEPGQWSSVLARFADLMGASAGSLTFQDQVTGKGRVIVHGTEPHMFDDYFGYYATRNPLLRIRDTPLALRVLTDEDKLPKRELVRGEYYNDFLRRMDAHSIMMLRLAIEGNETTVLNVVRPWNREPFDRQDLERAKALHPHLIRAYRVASKLSNMECVQSGYEAFLDRSANAVFVVDAEARLRHANRAGEALLAAKSGFAVNNRRLCAVGKNASRWLQAMIGAAGDVARECRTGSTMSLPRPGSTVPLSVIVVPGHTGRVPLLQPRPCVIVCAIDPSAPVAVPGQILRDVFGLSAAESRIVMQLIEGCDSRETARRLGLSYNTVRAHLVRIMHKTGTHRQAELVRLTMRATSGLNA